MSNPTQSIPLGGLSGLSSLLTGAGEGEAPLVSAQSSQVLVGVANDLVALGAQGTDLTTVGVNEVVNIWFLGDASGSMGGQKSLDLIEGQRAFLTSLRKDSRSKEMMLSQWVFGTGRDVVHPLAPVATAQMFGSGPGEYAYQAHMGRTRLMQTWQEMVAAAVAAHQYNEEQSVMPTPTTTICVVMTDGGETEVSGQGRTRLAGELQTLARDLIESERFILAYIGLDPYFQAGADIKSSRFYQNAKEMGFEDGCIGIDADVTKAFLRLSSSVSMVSSGKVQPGPQSSFFTP